MKFYYSKTTPLNFEEAKKKTIDELKKEGFGILSEINVKDKLKEKLGVDFRKYIILGSCNPPYAYKALQTEPMIGLMLPCNVVIQENNDNSVELSVIDPIASMVAIENDSLKVVATEIRDKLKTVLDRI